MMKSIYNSRCSAAQQNELILLTEDELLGSDLTSHGPHRIFIKCVSRMQSGTVGLPCTVAVTANLPLIIFIVAPCILIFTQFIHQQMHIY